MIKIHIDPNLAQMKRTMSFMERQQLPFATAMALTKTAKFVEGKIREEMPRVFDRPTRYTLNSLHTKPARKTDLAAEVKVKDESFKAKPPIQWLSPQIYGGGRGHKRFEERLIQAGVMAANEYAVPGSGAQLDGYGNMRSSQIVAILSDVQAHWDKAQNSTRESRAKRAKRRKRGGLYFAARAGGHLKPGVYERIGFAFGSAIRPVLIFTTKRPTYRKRLRFFEIAEQSGAMRFRLEFARAMRQAMATARARAA